MIIFEQDTLKMTSLLSTSLHFLSIEKDDTGSRFAWPLNEQRFWCRRRLRTALFLLKMVCAANKHIKIKVWVIHVRSVATYPIRRRKRWEIEREKYIQHFPIFPNRIPFDHSTLTELVSLQSATIHHICLWSRGFNQWDVWMYNIVA